MPSDADRFTRLQKVAIFLVALGEDRVRGLLAGLDLRTIEQLNAAILALGEVTPRERAAVLLEVGDNLRTGKPLKPSTAEPPDPPRRAARPGTQAPAAGPSARVRSQGATAAPRPQAPVPGRPARARPEAPLSAEQAGAVPSAPPPPPTPDPKSDDDTVGEALRHLRRRADLGGIDWGRAGYDFGEGFTGPAGGRR